MKKLLKMGNNKFIILILATTILFYIGLQSSCSSNSSGNKIVSNDTVSIARVKISDTTSFIKRDGKPCMICVEASFNYPTAYMDKDKIAKLQKLYAATILGAPDSLSLNEAMNAFVSGTLHQYNPSGNPAQENNKEESQEDDGTTEPVNKYNNNITVQVHYNANDILNLCRVDVVRKNDKITSVTHRYYTFDLQMMKRVGLNDLLADGTTADITKLLRSKLLEQNKVMTEEQLNELGYFNIDNLSATDNFCIDEHGITWSYMPNRLAVNAIGEPRITIDYETIEKYASDNSILQRIP